MSGLTVTLYYNDIHTKNAPNDYTGGIRAEVTLLRSVVILFGL